MTMLLVVGEVLDDRGHAPEGVKVWRLNGGMLMGRSEHRELPVTYDPDTGRFILLDSVFAAYSMQDGAESGPYQTGSSHVRIQGEGCKPLQLRLFDEMPYVRVMLERAEL